MDFSGVAFSKGIWRGLLTLVPLICAVENSEVADAGGAKTVLVFGDSWGDTGPTYHEVQDTLDRHGFPATVKSAAVGGTTACQWAARDQGMALVNAARMQFPAAREGPDFVWYTLGANDLADDLEMRVCRTMARTFDMMTDCLRVATSKILMCTEAMLQNYWNVFPNSKVMQSGYDLPCENLFCDITSAAAYDAGWCGLNRTCMNTYGTKFHEFHIGALSQRYLEPRYTGLNIQGTCQMAGGVVNASVGRPVLNQGSPCQWEELCVHPKYGTPAATAIGDAFWNLYFSKFTNSTSVLTPVHKAVSASSLAHDLLV